MGGARKERKVNFQSPQSLIVLFFFFKLQMLFCSSKSDSIKQCWVIYFKHFFTNTEKSKMMPCCIWIAICYLEDVGPSDWYSKACRKQNLLQSGWAVLLECGKHLVPSHKTGHLYWNCGGHSLVCALTNHLLLLSPSWRVSPDHGSFSRSLRKVSPSLRGGRYLSPSLFWCPKRDSCPSSRFLGSDSLSADLGDWLGCFSDGTGMDVFWGWG